MSNLAVSLANSIITRFPDPIDIPYRPWCYVQGYVLTGFEKLWLAGSDPAYFAYIKKFADTFVASDGKLSGFTGESLDDVMAGAVIVAMYQHTGEEKYRLAAQSIFASLHDYPRNSDGGFWHNRNLPHEMWIDGVFMGQMFLTRYGAVIGEPEACFREAVRQVTVLASHCAKGDTGLFLHAFDESRKSFWADPVSGLSPEVWSEGLGWYALILVETLALMPQLFPGKEKIKVILTQLLEGLRKMQDQNTGLWYQVVDKGEMEDNWHDTSGSAMFVYAIRKSVDLGFVPANIFTPVSQRGYQGILRKSVIHPDGLVDILDACDGVCVQKSYADYIHYPRVINAKEAVGGVLWAATIMEE